MQDCVERHHKQRCDDYEIRAETPLLETIHAAKKRARQNYHETHKTSWDTRFAGVAVCFEGETEYSLDVIEEEYYIGYACAKLKTEQGYSCDRAVFVAYRFASKLSYVLSRGV